MQNIFFCYECEDMGFDMLCPKCGENRAVSGVMEVVKRPVEQEAIKDKENKSK